MKPEITLDGELGVVRATTRGTFTMEEFEQAVTELKTALSGLDRQLILADVSDNERIMPPKEERDKMKEISQGVEWDKIAVIGADAFLRMSAKIVLATMNQSKTTKFFKTEADALEWLKGT